MYPTPQERYTGNKREWNCHGGFCAWGLQAKPLIRENSVKKAWKALHWFTGFQISESYEKISRWEDCMHV